MARVELTSHLHTFFPQLAEATLHFEVATVAAVVQALDALAPGLAFYLCDERGRLRRHVNIFVDGDLVSDRGRLSVPVQTDTRVLIMQALGGG